MAKIDPRYFIIQTNPRDDYARKVSSAMTKPSTTKKPPAKKQ